MSVITAADASRLLKIKYILPHQTTVNIEGKVTAVSEIIRINKDCVFMVELQGGAKIIVKQAQFFKWNDQLVIGNSFVITNLRPTTLSESYRPQQRVFVPWTDSQLFTSGADTSLFSQLSLQEWLACLGLLLPEEEKYCVEDCSEEDAGVAVHTSLAFYQGVVTDTGQSVYNIFELDNKTQLFLCHLPKLQCPKVLLVGDRVTVYNVHQSLCPKTQKKQLLCCTRSSIHIDCKEQQTEEASTARDTTAAESSPPLTLLQQYSFTQNNVLPLLRLYQDVCHVLGQQQQHKKSEKKSSVKKVLHYLVGSLYPANRHPVRNYVMEFCQHQAFCPLDTPMDEMGEEVPQLTHVSQLAEDTAARDMACDTDGGSASHTDSEETVWTFDRKTVDKHVLGWLALNPSTGRLQLADSKGAMDLVIVWFSVNACRTTTLVSGTVSLQYGW